MMTGETTVEQNAIALPQMTEPIKAIYVDPRQQWLYVVNGRAQVDVFSLHDKSLNGRYKLFEEGDREVSSSNLLLGGISLMIGDSKGDVSQWFMVRGADGEARLTHIRSFQLGQAPVVQIAPEERRKGFLALDASGKLGVFHSTAERTLLIEQVTDGAGVMAFSPRANRVVIEEGGQLLPFSLRNPHPEVSWSALGQGLVRKLRRAPVRLAIHRGQHRLRTQAEPGAADLRHPQGRLLRHAAGRPAGHRRRHLHRLLHGAEHAPQGQAGDRADGSAADGDPRLLRRPVPGALRRGHLPGIFSLLLLTPIGILLAGFLWSRLPESIRLRVPDGFEAAILIPVVLLVGWLALGMSPLLEAWFFGGDMRLWISNDLGITYDQRNALIVGLAMGFAVIPNIFSIAEDAIFSVPRSLTYGSLALGATPWQTLTRVVILTASPGIFSALMIGLGRAVGETMIVLMATGNTPVMEVNIFEGMRTLAANVAVEMPESEVGGSHYRVLFLAALVLLMFTFVMNTLAELIRQRLRKKYASL